MSVKQTNETDNKTNDSVFRQSSIDRLNSPEQLNAYIRVAKPGVWLLLTAIILLLVGALAWGIFGLVQTKIECGARVGNGVAVCYVNADQVKKIKVGDPAAVADVQGEVRSVSASPISAEGGDAYLLRLSGLTVGESCYLVELDAQGLAAGVYPAVITVESLRPISFVIR